MADFFTRLVSRTLSGLEPTVKPLIVPMYASGAKMADNYAVYTASELGFSVSGEYDSDESPMGQSPELLGISAAETLSQASNITPINWEQIQLPNHPLEITSGEQLESDRAIALDNSIKAIPSSESIQPLDNSSEITSSEQLEPDMAIAPEKSIKAIPSSESIQPLDNSSEITSSEQLEPDMAIAPEKSIKAIPSSESIQPLDNPSEITSSEQLESDRAIAPENSIKASPSSEVIQPSNNPSEITSSEQLKPELAIAPENSIKASSPEKSSPLITPSIASSTNIQKSTSQDTVNLTSTIQPLDNSSEIISSEQLEPDRAIAPEAVINSSSSEESSPPINPSLAPSNVIQSSQDTVNVNPTSLETIQPLDNSSEIISSEQLEPDMAIAPEAVINSSSSEASSAPINPSSAPSTNIQSSRDTVNVNPTSLETIQPLDNSSEIISSEQLEPDMAIAPENSIKASSPEKSSPLITPSSVPSNVIQKLSSQDTVNVNPTSLESIQPLDNSSEITSSEQLESDSALAPEAVINSSSTEKSSSPIAPSIQKSSSSDVKPISRKNQSVSELASQLSSNQNSDKENASAEEGSLIHSNNQSSQVISRKVSLPLVASEVVAPLPSLPLNPPGQVEPPVNRVESIQSIEINPASESNTLATYSSFPQNDLTDTALSTSSPPSPKSFPTKNVVKNQIFPLVQSGETRIMRSPNASETVSRSPGSSEIKTGAIEPQNTSFTTSLPQPSNSQEISMTPIPFTKGELTSQLLTDTSPNKSMTTVTNSQNFSSQEDKTSNPSRLGINTQSKLVEEGVQPQQISENKSKRIDSNLSSTGNSLSSLGYSVHTSPDQLQNTESSHPSPPSLASDPAPTKGARQRRFGSPHVRASRGTRFESPPELASDPAPTKGTRQRRFGSPHVRARWDLGGKNLRDETQETYVYTVGSLGGKDLAIARPRLRQTESIPFKIEPRLEITRQELPQSPEQLSELPLPSKSEFPASRQLSQTSQTGGLETASGSPRNLTNATTPSTPTINITIGRVEVRGIKPPEPPPMKKLRAKTPQLSLSDYLKERGGQ